MSGINEFLNIEEILIFMKMPNFLIIGAPKSGTTALYNYLGEHPQIYFPEKKEPHFFSFEGRTQGFNGPGQSDFMKRRVTKLEDYYQIFEGVNNEIAIGEASTSYLYIPEAVERIYNYIPEVKIIAILRNPVDRAFSHYLHHWRNGGEVYVSFYEALQQEEIRQQNNWSPFWQYKGIGCYYTHLKPYYDRFEAKQIKVYLYDDFDQDPLRIVQDIFSFVGVDSNFVPDVKQRYNIGRLRSVPRSLTLQRFLTQDNQFKSWLKNFLPLKYRNMLRKYLQKKNKIKVDYGYKPELSKDVRQDLQKEYREEILKLEELLERDLSTWLKSE